jgi:arylsulfatase A-like enzyme
MDTARADHCTVLDPTRRTTPELAEFAKDAVSYSDAWIPAGWTAPAHASMFTGQRIPKHRLVGDGPAALRANSITLAELLRDAGYRTALFSDNPVVGPVFGLDQGFSFAPPIALDMSRERPHARDNHRLALDYLKRADEEGKPAFVYVNDFEAHLPYEPPEEMQASFLPSGVAPELLAEARRWNNPLTFDLILGRAAPTEGVLPLLAPLYDAEIATVDRELGTLFGQMRESGLLDRTLVIVTSDHGENLGDHGLWDHRFSLHRTLRHVPLVVRYPGSFDGGRVVTDVVRTEDLFPTVLEVCGVPAASDLDGVSLLDPTADRLSRATYGRQLHALSLMRKRYPDIDPTLFETSLRAVYDGRHHLIVGTDGSVQLYDVTNDPGEVENLAESDPESVRRLTELLDPEEPRRNR